MMKMMNMMKMTNDASIGMTTCSRTRRLAALLIAMVTVSGCYASVSGDVRVDGRQFGAKGCRAGQAFGFSGIELSDEAGRRLRLVANPDGTCVAAWFPVGEAVGENVGMCGLLVMQAQSSRVNGIINLKGSATLDCASTAHKVSGQVKFENCH